MSIFISHKQEDSQRANIIFNYFKENNIDSYLDVVDNIDSKVLSPDQLTNYIVNKVQQCTHLLAFITPATRASWWVPFEIGIAHQMGKKIVTANEDYDGLPEYLKAWPVIEIDDPARLEWQLRLMVGIYLSDNQVAKSFDFNNPYKRHSISPVDFNQRLRKAFGQLAQ